MLEQGEQRHRRELFRRGRGNAEQQGSGGGLRQAACRRCRPPRCPNARAAPTTRAASWRSGVTSAAVLPGVSSASRSASAIACASAAGSGKLGEPDAAQPPLGGRQGLPFVREVGRRHRVGDRARRAPATMPHRRTSAMAAPRSRATPSRSSSSFRWNCGCVGFAAPVLVRAQAPPIPRRGRRSASHKPGSTTIPSGIRATRATSAATAGAAVVMPAATVNPGGGSSFHRSASRCSKRLRRSARSIAPCSAKQLRPVLVDQLQLRERVLPVAREVVRLGHRLLEPSRIDLLDQQRIERPREVGGQPQASPRVPSPGTIDARRSSRSVGIDRRRDRLTLVDPIERAADALIELGIADRDQPRQQQAAAARSNERLGHAAHGTVVRQQDAALRQRQRVLAEARDQPRCKRIGERAMRGNGENGDPLRVRHSPAPLPSSGWTGEYRRRTTGPGGPPRTHGPPRSPGPTGCWSRTAPRAHRGAAASRRSGCR